MDAPALVSIGFRDSGTAQAILNGLSTMVQDGSLCFCEQVVNELDWSADGEVTLLWAKATTGSLAHKGADYSLVEWVGIRFGALIDDSARASRESAAPYVVAQALSFQRKRAKVTVVTEDLASKPTRASLAEACAFFRLRTLDLDGFLDEVGLP